MTFILLSSAREDQAASRSFQQFSNRDELAKRLIVLFEDYLRCFDADVINHGAGSELVTVTKDENGQERRSLNYTSDDLFAFIDSFFGEMVCLEQQDNDPLLWIPYSTSWVKEAIYLYFRNQADMQARYVLEAPEAEQPKTMMEAMEHDFSDSVHMLVS